ncbi:hypothetical protein Sjap_013970 [Stephania japonica]|uniref:Uncharacterized protein n=1 Tax=Stephania japonica TaxID=461633 RepID=A0AAP0J0Q9_9MAGN
MASPSSLPFHSRRHSPRSPSPPPSSSRCQRAARSLGSRTRRRPSDLDWVEQLGVSPLDCQTLMEIIYANSQTLHTIRLDEALIGEVEEDDHQYYYSFIRNTGPNFTELRNGQDAKDVSVLGLAQAVSRLAKATFVKRIVIDYHIVPLS